MRNSLKVLTRDLGRIARAPKVWAIIGGLIIIPSLYAWFNIVAFWNPYGNTQDVAVAVVNLDKGASSDLMGKLNVGDQVVDQLKDNHQLGWKFLDEKAAMTAVKSGDVYATIIIPAGFSKELLSLTTGHFVQPQLEYYVNEKANPIAPKITAVGASTLQTQVNSTFVSTVAKTISTDLEKAGVATGQQLLSTKNNTLSALDQAETKVKSAQTGLTQLNTGLSDARTALNETKAALVDTENTIGDVQTTIDQAQSLVDKTQQELVNFTGSITDAYVSSATLLSDASSKLNAGITQVATGALQANVQVSAAIDDAKAVSDASGKALTELTNLLAGMDPSAPGYTTLKDAVGELQTRHDADQTLLTSLQTLNSKISDATSSLKDSADAMNAAVKQTTDSAQSVRTVLLKTIPDVNRALSAMSASAGAFSSALGTQSDLVAQSVSLLTSLNTQLGDTITATDALSSNLSEAAQGLSTVRTDVTALSTADIWSQVKALTDLNPDQIAKFMASPVQVKEHNLFPVPTYGSAMAPLFTNLSLWIGAFMLVVLMKQEVDTEGVSGLTVRQAYFGRWMLLACLAILQALLVSIGNIVIGVQMANAFAFVGTSVFVGLVYLSIIYALAVSFGYVGKGIIILLVVMQIPGASGIYPIEMMPGFFRALFPFFPFTYSINAMRETIGGFYGDYYWENMGVMVIFAGLGFLIGVFFRQRLGNFSRLFNRRLEATDLFVIEQVQVLGSRRRLSQLVQVLTDRAKFREKTARRARWLDEHHLTVVRVIFLIGIVATAILAVYGFMVPDAKATVLAAWGIVCLLTIGALVTLEYLKQNVVYASHVDDLPADEVREALLKEEVAVSSNASLDELRADERELVK